MISDLLQISRAAARRAFSMVEWVKRRPARAFALSRFYFSLATRG